MQHKASDQNYFAVLELCKVEIDHSNLDDPYKERKYVAATLAAFMRYDSGSNLQQCADYIVSALSQWHSDLPLACVIGDGCGFWVEEEDKTEIIIFGVLGMRIDIHCIKSSHRLRNPPIAADVEAVIPSICKTYEMEFFGAHFIKDALNKRFPIGWNCANSYDGKALVVSFRSTFMEKLIQFEHLTETARFIIWAWKA